jgi:hypothetical protein
MDKTQTTFRAQFKSEQNAYVQFRRALRRTDQYIFDELWVGAIYHRAAVEFATVALPMEAILLSMLIEERKFSKHLQVEIEALQIKLNKLSQAE